MSDKCQLLNYMYTPALTNECAHVLEARKVIHLIVNYSLLFLLDNVSIHVDR